MENRILGLHHITAIAGDAQRNHDFYTRRLGLRLVKKTVNFDDPGTYHFYYGNETGAPGTILTFFPWEGMRKGSVGTGIASGISYSVPANSLAFWKERFENLKIRHQAIEERFGEQVLPFEDPDGLLLNLVVPEVPDTRVAWTNQEIKEDVAIKGFHSVELTIRKLDATAKILTDLFGYTLYRQDGNRYRFNTDAVSSANMVDIVEEPTGIHAINAAGTNHHVAFRVQDDAQMMEIREKVKSAGLSITAKIDRNYFYSLYFREPGGILFEIASDNPGFAIDEKISELGTQLMLPSQYEIYRDRIEGALPVIR